MNTTTTITIVEVLKSKDLDKDDILSDSSILWDSEGHCHLWGATWAHNRSLTSNVDQVFEFYFVRIWQVEALDRTLVEQWVASKRDADGNSNILTRDVGIFVELGISDEVTLDLVNVPQNSELAVRWRYSRTISSDSVDACSQTVGR